MHEHFSQKMRRILDASPKSKGILFWILSPLLFIVSITWALIAFYKRKQGYENFENLTKNFPNHIKVLSVGNILLGGTGKTPIVRALAEKHLSRGLCVAIASRGIHGKPIMINSLNFTVENLNKLSDENREHFEILHLQYPNTQFFIYQNQNRANSLKHFCEMVKSDTSRQMSEMIKTLEVENSFQHSMFILDDGLQYFNCPRHKNICVGDLNVDGIALPFAMPLGPYREGFGKDSMQRIMSQFDLCLWPQKSYHIEKSSTHFPYKLSQNYFVTAALCLLKCEIMADGKFTLNHLDSCTKNLHLKNASILTGIAHPNRFVEDLSQLDERFLELDKIFLADHGSISEDILEELNSSDTVILTMKDFFRFCTEHSFIKFASKRTIYGCYLKYDLSYIDV